MVRHELMAFAFAAVDGDAEVVVADAGGVVVEAARAAEEVTGVFILRHSREAALFRTAERHDTRMTIVMSIPSTWPGDGV